MNKCAKLFSTGAAALMLAALLLTGGAGCGSQTEKLSAEQGKAFDSAPADVKQTWDKALAADKANDYLNAQKYLDGLNQMILSDPQRQALTAERAEFGERLMKAANNNDPDAIKALLNSQKSRNR